MIQLAVFDLAGTTVRDGDEVAASLRAALRETGLEPTLEDLRTVMGLPKPEALRLLSARGGRPGDPLEVERLHASFQRHMRDHYLRSPGVAEIPGAGEVFARLRSHGIRVGLNTGFDRSIVDVLLRRLGWTVPEVVDAVVTSDEVERGRPHPDMIRRMMSLLKVEDPRRVAKVGDTWADLEEGTQAGCGWVIGVATGAFTAEKLRERPHTHIVGSVREVPGLLLGADG